MVFALVFITVVFFLLADYFIKREDKKTEKRLKENKSPIFLSPEKALLKLGDEEKRLYHTSHTWAMKSENKDVYVGLDDFVSEIFSDTVKVEKLPFIGEFVSQGSEIWQINYAGKLVKQLAPVSGEVIEINPALKMDIPLASKDLEHSWMVKIKPKNYDNERNNLINHEQHKFIAKSIRDEVIMNAQEEHFLNDGGEIHSDFIKHMEVGEWNDFLKKYFPYH
ncbi:MAG: hypothetical protein JEY94_11680 [Melioribacteraceae bacterium]|nr:hypothetical protein [Melioribacteraceae bacterium]